MGYNSVNAPRLDSFRGAVTWRNSVKPIRGHAEQVRPLGERRYHHAANITMPDPDTVLLNFYGFKLVEWHSDNTFTLHAPKYYSAYSCDQVSGFVPRSMGFSWEKGRMFVHTGGKSTELARRQSLKFVSIGKTSSGYPIFEVVGAPDVHVYRVKRGVAETITDRRFGAFLEWVRMTSSIVKSASSSEISRSREQFATAVGYPKELLEAKQKAVEHMPWNNEREMVSTAITDVQYLPYAPGRLGGTFHRASSELFARWMDGDNMEKWLDALNVIQHHIGEHRYYRHDAQIGVYIKPEKLYGYVKSIAAFLYRDEAFKVLTLPAGTVPSKRNAEYFREVHINFGQTDSVSECS